MKTVTVVTEVDGPEAIYVDGLLVFDDCTVYACEIAGFAGEEPILLRHVECEMDGDHWKWPEKLEDLPVPVN